MQKSAVLSTCRQYRYSLSRVWDEGLPLCAFVGLNPSTADETVDDNTIRRCMGFALEWGFGGLVMLNLFAFRTKSPEIMKAAPHPVGLDNDGHLLEWKSKCSLVIAAWGIHGSHMGRDRAVKALLGGGMRCLGLTKAGHPKHPLFVLAATETILYS